MTAVAAAALVFATLLLFARLGVVERARRAVATARAAAGDLRNPSLHDDEKERAMRAHAGRLFGLFLQLVLLALVALSLPLGILWLLALLHWVDFGAVLDAALSWQILTLASAVALVLALWGRARRR